jgi:glyoxylase-like metal-dependent hydrolase (beta-lactamase superfamily II)/8-oxo-dGTP pyrophosphatase MutT (NUDIX family)
MDRPSSGTPAVPRPAATVVLVRPGKDGLEVLLTRRPATMAFAADAYVFPGGAIDSGDAAASAIARSVLDAAAASRALGGDAEPDEALAAHVAAVRELWEEAGVAFVSPRAGGDAADARERDAKLSEARAALLEGRCTIGEVAADLDVVLRTDWLVPLSRWVTPAFVPRRFDVRFFVADLPGGVEPTFDPREVVEHRWLTPRAALDAMAADEISLWVPTSTTLQQLEHMPSVEALRAAMSPGASVPIGLDEVAPGVVRIVLPGAGGIGGQSVNAWLVGRREIVVVDPGDPSEAASDAITALAEARGAHIVAIALTQAAPDHAAGVEALAVGLGVPVFGGRDAGRDLSADVQELGDGDRLPVGDEPIVALAAPGPRPDHTAWVLADAAAVITGDLVGPGPSRSIVGPADVPAWLASLDRVEALAPQRLLPGHGDVPVDRSAAMDAQRARLRPD